MDLRHSIDVDIKKLDLGKRFDLNKINLNKMNLDKINLDKIKLGRFKLDRKTIAALPWGWIALGALASSAAVYFLSPKKGSARRAQFGSRATSIGGWLKAAPTRSYGAVSGGVQTLVQKGRDLLPSSAEPVDDRTLMETIRMEMSRIVSNPSEVEVIVQNGAVRLNGPIGSSEVQPLLNLIKGISGVRNVENHLSLQDERKVANS